MTIVIQEMEDGRQRLLVDRGQVGLYETEAKAKAGARRFLKAREGITWKYGQGEAIAAIGPKRGRK